MINFYICREVNMKKLESMKLKCQNKIKIMDKSERFHELT